MLLCSKLIYCLRLPIHSMLEGGDPNVKLGVMKVPRIMLLRSQLCLLSLAPYRSNAKGRYPKCYAWGLGSPEDNAASQQILFIVSGSPSIQC